MRGFVKGAIGQVASSADRLLGRSLFPEAAAGDTLLLAGENWSRHDFAGCAVSEQRHGLRIAALLQDMIPHVRPQFFESPAFIARFGPMSISLSTTPISSSRSRTARATISSTQPRRPIRPRSCVSSLAQRSDRRGRQQRPAGLGAMGERPFVLAVSTIQVRKNFDLLYRLWQKFSIDGRADQPHLVIVGREGFGSADLLHLMRNDPCDRRHGDHAAPHIRCRTRLALRARGVHLYRPGMRGGVCRSRKAWPMARPSSPRTRRRSRKPDRGSVSISILTTSSPGVARCCA